MTILTELSASDLAAGIKAKKFSCQEVMQAYLAQITQVNPKINAIVQLNAEQALQQALAADQALAEGKATGKLHGVPVTLKDHLKVKDFIVTRGCTGLKNHRCNEDSAIAARLKAEGAIVLGITNMPEIGPIFESDNKVYGQTKNPYDLSKTSGGSSGGEAAILASGGSALGIGSDGAGSIRLPAHFCGIAGIKPTQHLLPCTGNVPSDGGIGMFYYTPGPMARFVKDLKLALPLIAGSDGIDPHVMPFSLSTQSKPINNMRIGYVIENSVSKVDNDTIAVMQNAITILNKATQPVEAIDFLDIGYAGKFHWETFFYAGDQGNSYRQLLKSLHAEISLPMQRFLEAAAQSAIFDATEIRRRFFEADQIRMQALQHMQNYDVIITPACATPAKPHGTTQAHIWDFVYTMAFNLLGWPACVVRCGTSKDGLPIGLQIAANPWRDYDALTVAEFLENQLGGWQKPSI
jgi:amidase